MWIRETERAMRRDESISTLIRLILTEKRYNGDRGGGSGKVVSLLAFYSDNLSSNPDNLSSNPAVNQKSENKWKNIQGMSHFKNEEKYSQRLPFC